MKKVLFAITIIVSIIVFSYQNNDVHSSTSGAPAGRSGSPADNGNCTSCHAGTAISNSPNAVITSTIPSTGYVPGQTYTITGTVLGTGLVKFGFEISPQAINGTYRGTMVVTDAPNTQITGTKYITHKTAGTAGSGSRSWSFNWVAPAANTGDFSFYGAFNATNNQGSSTGDIIYLATLPVVEAAQIATQPTAVAACVGGNATFTVAATGSNLSYLWKRNGAPLSNGGTIAGATSATLTITGVIAGDVGNYTVDVIGSGNTVTSTIAALTLNAATAISTNPTNQTVCVGSNTSLTVAATGGNLSYQWKKGIANVGTNSPTLSFNNTTGNDAGSYTCVVTGSCGNATSTAAVVTINPATAIGTQPQGQTLCAGSTLTLTVAATGTGNLSYQWKRGTTNVGTNSATLTVNSITANDAGQYTCLVTGGCGNATSNAVTVTVNPATAVTNQPVGQSACVGSNVTFNVSAAGIGLLYEWRKNGAPIQGQSSPTLTLNNVTLGDTADYTCRIIGTCGTVFSNPATLTIINSAAISQQPQSQSACIGEPLALNVVGTGGTNTVYQWSKNGQPVGTNSATFTIPVFAIGDTGNYTVTITGDCGTVESGIANVANANPPQINSMSLPLPICEGSAVDMAVQATGDNLSYQWYKNGNEITNETNAFYSDQNPANNDVYTCSVFNSCDSITSSPVTVTVNAAPLPVISQPIGFTMTTGTFVAYQWLDENKQIIQGANAIQYSPQNAQARFYYVVVTDANGCSDTSASFFYEPLGITENLMPILSIYPNPSAGDVYFAMPANNGSFNVQIINGMGQLVLDAVVENNYLNIGQLPAGIYTLSTIYKNKPIRLRLAKQ